MLHTVLVVSAIVAFLSVAAAAVRSMFVNELSDLAESVDALTETVAEMPDRIEIAIVAVNDDERPEQSH